MLLLPSIHPIHPVGRRPISVDSAKWENILVIRWTGDTFLSGIDMVIRAVSAEMALIAKVALIIFIVSLGQIVNRPARNVKLNVQFFSGMNDDCLIAYRIRWMEKNLRLGFDWGQSVLLLFHIYHSIECTLLTFMVLLVWFLSLFIWVINVEYISQCFHGSNCYF